jgi:hypothetical protein
MGQWAVQYLIEHGNAPPEVPPIQHVIHCPLVERAST